MVRYLSLILIIGLSLLNHILCVPNAALSQKDMIPNKKKQVVFDARLVPAANSIGQVGGIDTDLEGNLVVFHRGSRKWAFENYGPIQEDVLTLIDTRNLVQLDSWGAKKFFMPHGLTIDSNGNYWLTDVGLHQVFKFDLKKSSKPLLTLGVRFEKGYDDKHFCKPTSVAVAQLTGDIFISDGYCNTRVVHFDKDGNYIKEFTDKDSTLIVVHSVTLIEEQGLICTVSREEGRIVCFDIQSGEKKHVITDPNMKTVYAIQYDPFNQVIQAVTGPNADLESFGLTFDAREENFGKLIQKWQSKSGDLTDAHDLTLTPDASKIFVGQLNAEIDQFSYN